MLFLIAAALSGALHCWRCCWNNFHPFHFPLQHQFGHSGRCGRLWHVFSVLWQVSGISKSWSPWDGLSSVVCSCGILEKQMPQESQILGESPQFWEAQFGQWMWILQKWYLGPTRIHRCPMEYLYSKGYVSIYFNLKKIKGKKEETAFLWKN